MNGTKQMNLFSEEGTQYPPASTLSPEGSRNRVKILALQESKPASAKKLGPDCGQNVFVLLANYDPITHSLRTLQTCFLAQAKNEADGLAEYSQTWPQSGMMSNGTLYQLPTLVHGIDGAESGYLPTPTKSDAKGASKGRYYHSKTYRGNLREFLRNGPEDPIYPHPDFVSQMMGFPIGWSELN